MNNKSMSLSKSNFLPRTIVVLIIVFTTILCITICSKSSPIYPLNNWEDANCFFTVGKTIKYNIVLYRDIFEQKGPVLYYIYFIASLISPDSFFGGYILEIVSGCFFLFFVYKSLLLFADSKIVFLLPIEAAIVFGSEAFADGGSAEEFCLPFLALGNYFALKALKRSRPLSYKEWILVGVCSSIVLWIKFSLLGLFIGYGIFFLFFYIYKKWLKRLFFSILFLLLGIVIVFVPIFIYFYINNALSDLFEVYFYDNLFLYSFNYHENKLINLFVVLLYGLLSFIKHQLIGFVLVIAGGIYFFLLQKRIFFYYILSFTFLFFFVFSGGRRYIYYSLPLSIFVPFGILLFWRCIQRIKLSKVTHRIKIRFNIIGLLIECVAVSALLVMSPNTYMLKYQKDDLPQYKFDRIISASQNPTLLNYGSMDGGFYTVSNIVPNCRFFCSLNIPLGEIGKVQDYYIKNELVDYVVTGDKQLSEEQLTHYVCVCEEPIELFKGHFKTYYLYKNKKS